MGSSFFLPKIVGWGKAAEMCMTGERVPAADGGSEKQMTDALGVYEVQRDGLDDEYLSSWAQRLGVTDLLRKLRDRAAGAA